MPHWGSAGAGTLLTFDNYRLSVPAPHNKGCTMVSEFKRLPALDGVRGIAILLVLVGHSLSLRHDAESMLIGRLGVVVFFVLSGYLITSRLLMEEERQGAISIKKFYRRRALRIFPAFYVFWIVCIVAAMARHVSVPWGEALAPFFYMGDYYSALHASHVGQIMGVTWSLGVEEKFYLLWPAMFAFLHRNPVKLFRFALASIGAIWLYRIVMCLAFSLPIDYLRYAFESRFDNILYGCALALGLKLLKIEPLLAAVNRFNLMPFVAGAALIALAASEDRFSTSFIYIAGMALMSMLVATMLIQLVFLGSIRGWRWLDNRLFRFFGKISYSLYLYHIVVIASVQYFLPDLRARYSFPLMYAGSIALAWGSYVVIEKPFLRLKDRFAVVTAADESRSSAGRPQAHMAGVSNVAS